MFTQDPYLILDFLWTSETIDETDDGATYIFMALYNYNFVARRGPGDDMCHFLCKQYRILPSPWSLLGTMFSCSLLHPFPPVCWWYLAWLLVCLTHRSYNLHSPSKVAVLVSSAVYFLHVLEYVHYFLCWLYRCVLSESYRFISGR